MWFLVSYFIICIKCQPQQKQQKKDKQTLEK